jgi:uncharacterized protein (TIRG00374 family)
MPDHSLDAATTALVGAATAPDCTTAAPAPLRGVDGPTLGRMVRKGLPWILTGGLIYLLAPSVLGVLAATNQLVDIDWWWLLALVAAQVLVLFLTWELQRLLIHDGEHGRPSLALVASSQLVGNAVATAAPLGGAAGTAAQVRVLAKRGVEPRRATAGILTFSLLQVASVGALAVIGPIMVVLGVAVPATLAKTALLGCGAMVVITIILVLVLRTDRAADWIGAAVGIVLPRQKKRTIVMLRRERRHLRRALSGRGRAPKVLSLALARSIADYLCLLAAVAAVTPTPNPALVLLAFVAAAVLRMLPLTPGGLGPVEAVLIPLLAAAGLTKSGAVLATLAYRVASLWLPLLFAIPAMWWLRRNGTVEAKVLVATTG